MKLLDLFCGAGGAAQGYHQAGFDVTGVDIKHQPRYPFSFIQADALGMLDDTEFLQQFDVIHASPPCQPYSIMKAVTARHGRQHPQLIEPVREKPDRAGLPYVIENVIGAPMKNAIVLCGAMFGLRTYRHRIFESNLLLLSSPCKHLHNHKTAKQGRRPADGEFITVTGNFPGAAIGRQAMGIDWMRRAELTQAIPPAYTEYVGRQLINALKGQNSNG